MFACFRFIVLAFLLVPVSSFAANDDWRVAKATKEVRYSLGDAKWIDLHAGDVLPNHASITTGTRGRALLVRGVERIEFQPNTTASITTTSGFLSPRKTEIKQQIGSLELEIEKRSQPHTTVQTPFLAAVVKGTIFHVSVSKTAASVKVDRGLVQVTSFASGQQANVGPKQSASVGAKTGMSVAGQEATPSITSVPASAAKLPAAGSKKLGSEKQANSNNKPSKADDGSKAANGKSHFGGSSIGGDRSSNGNNGSDRSRGSGNGNGNSGDTGHGNGGNNGAKGNNSGSGNHGNSASGNNGNGHGRSGNNGNGKGGSGNNGNGNGNGKGR
ncbi:MULTISPECIES: FecR domain-containing protein [unclassified Rhizobium]|uniref:FecR domain-containing protein n=1 Tax=Rhizobium sp. BK399 TaxID=2587063 RepID=UPI001622D59A|nr:MULTISPECIES: FecR domain-containing protein [unclassified Rhizobium]MBB3545317.1 hypothetical protein [Rhizobium sp. BK399]